MCLSKQNEDLLIDNLGSYLFKKGVIGQITIEFVVFNQDGDELFWAIDLKYGISDYAACFNFADFMGSQADKIMEDSLVARTFTNTDTEVQAFCCPMLCDHSITELSMRTLVDAFRNNVFC